ncbi:MAG TPA: methyltransferase domain-containing protein [Longimicrobium sp.]|nr:methyltransferase domain-containing protein [Longimicrobium sp.]
MAEGEEASGARAAEYYDAAWLDGAELPGTGIVGLTLGDQLHPPMVDDAGVWGSGPRWVEGARECTRRLAAMAGIGPADTVLDVGCGVGGAVRQLSEEFGCRAVGLNVSALQLHTAASLGGPGGRIGYLRGDAQRIPARDGAFTCAWTFNMFYHIPDKPQALREMHRVVAPGGRLAFDDWVLTGDVDAAHRAQLRHHWSSPEWMTDGELLDAIHEAGFELRGEPADWTHVGAGVMRRLFPSTWDRDFAPRIRALDAEWGQRMADDFRDAVQHTIDLYASGRLRYLQLVACRR